MKTIPDVEIIVHGFELVAEEVSADQLRELGDSGFNLIAAWPLNVEDYGHNKFSFVFRKDE